jgi:hypothetical protein
MGTEKGGFGMIEFLGWFALAAGGAYCLGAFTVMLVAGFGLGGLASIPPALFAGAVVAIGWISFVIWWSPLTISIGA